MTITRIDPTADNPFLLGRQIDTAGAPIKQPITAPSESSQLENNFITLLVAQIANQDPTKPVDSTEFLNQFATLSQVKSLENMTALGKTNLVLLDNLQTLTAAGLVGQEVKVQTDHIQISDQVLSGAANLEHAADDVVLVLTDSTGVTHDIKLGAQPPGPLDFKIDPAALGLKPGTYQIELKSASGEKPRVEIAGQVTRVRVSEQGPVLDVAGVGAVPFYQITEFSPSLLADGPRLNISSTPIPTFSGALHP